MKVNKDLLKGLAFFGPPIECVTSTISKSSDWSANGEAVSSFPLPGDMSDHSPPTGWDVEKELVTICTLGVRVCLSVCAY